MKIKSFILSLFCLIAVISIASTPSHRIRGKVIDKTTREPLEYINIFLSGSELGAVTDINGEFNFDNIAPGAYILKASAVGRKSLTSSEYLLSTHDIYVTMEMEQSATELSGITVTVSPFRRDVDSPLGLRIIGIQEIEKSPGANRDISRIVQSYPGVAFSPAGYRNDLIVRGGSPSENRFYLDGIEIPNINHFSTEGASGGPVGIINADLIREVKFYSSSFPANKSNALSSVLDFKLRDGSLDRYTLKATVGASEFSLASTGHLGTKSTYSISMRQSYLQLLFKMLGLPFLPKFTDGQVKIKTQFNRNNELSLLGLAGIDNMKLNTSLTGEKSEYMLSYLPTIKQETFTVGAVYNHYHGKHQQTVVLSYNYLNNRNLKYLNNDESIEDNLTLKLRSIEQEAKIRFENTSSLGNWKLNVGANADLSFFNINSFQKSFISAPVTLTYDTRLSMARWGIFGSANYTTPNERFTATFGIRSDANGYSSDMRNMLKHISPRISLSYNIIENLYVSGNAGMYYQLPPYTALGYKNNADEYVNKNLKYMRVTQSSIGVSWQTHSTFNISLEGFYKAYSDIPLSLSDNIPLTCKGDDYGVIGNETLVSSAQGRAYGLELLARWIIAKRLNLSSSLTIFKSDFRSSSEAQYIASAWDNKYIFNINGTYNLPRNWSVGAKVKSIGGAPYTPYDVEKSSLVTAWNAKGRPYYDYSLYNTERMPAFTQLDIRIDKIFYIKNCMLGFYIDLQNVTVSKYQRPDVLMSTGVIANPTASLSEQRYIMKYISQKSGTLLPTLGITFEF